MDQEPRLPAALVPGEEAGNVAASIVKAPKEAANILKNIQHRNEA